jgi:predicted Zn-dependent peptidase
MKKVIAIIASIIILAGIAIAQEQTHVSAGSKIVKGLPQEPIQLNVPRIGVEVERTVLDNGIVLFLYENHTLPLVNVNVMLHGGGLFDPKGKEGLAQIVGTVMRTGGSKSISGDSLNILMEYIGGSLETGMGQESGSASVNLLSKDIDLGLRLLADVLRNPAFPEDKLELAKTDIRNNIKRRNDNPGGIARRYYNNIIYGNHPFGQILEWASVKNITVQDISDFHKRFFIPNNIMIGISGDFNKEEMRDKIKLYFGNWPKSDLGIPSYPPVELKYDPGVFQVKKDLNQSNIMVGHLGIKFDNPDRYAIGIMNYILGGGSFFSRLTTRIRSDEGLAYHAGSSFQTDSRDYGTFTMECQTKSGSTHRAIEIMLEEIAKIQKDGVTASELNDARDAVINRFVFKFDNANKILTSLMRLEFDGYPADYYDKYLDNYRKITLDDIKRVAQTYLKPAELTFLVVGNADQFEKSLDDFGKITDIELSAPVIQ